MMASSSSTGHKKVTFSHLIETTLTPKFYRDPVSKIRYPWHEFSIQLLPKHFDVFVSHVDVFLHVSYDLPNRTITPPFILTERAWGNYNISVTCHFVDEFSQPIKLPPLPLKFSPSFYEEQRALIFRGLDDATKHRFFSHISNIPSSSSSSSSTSLYESVSRSSSSSSLMEEDSESAAALLKQPPTTAKSSKLDDRSISPAKKPAVPTQQQQVMKSLPPPISSAKRKLDDLANTPTNTIKRSRPLLNTPPARPNASTALAAASTRPAPAGPFAQFATNNSAKSIIKTNSVKSSPNPRSMLPLAKSSPTRPLIKPATFPKPSTALLQRQAPSPGKSNLLGSSIPKPSPVLPSSRYNTSTSRPTGSTKPPPDLTPDKDLSPPPSQHPPEPSVVVPGSGGIRLRKARTCATTMPDHQTIPSAAKPQLYDRELLTNQLALLNPQMRVALAKELYKVGLAEYEPRDGIYVYFCKFANSLIVDLGGMPTAELAVFSKVLNSVLLGA